MQTVLIADDDAAVRDMLATGLIDGGFEVIAQVGNGIDAVRLANHHVPDVAIVDLMMPWVNGFDAIREIAASCPETRIVVFSVLDDHADEQLALELGAHSFLRKCSVSPEEVAARLRELANQVVDGD